MYIFSGQELSSLWPLRLLLTASVSLLLAVVVYHGVTVNTNCDDFYIATGVKHYYVGKRTCLDAEQYGRYLEVNSE
jgi:hypothetical protein